MESLIFHGTGGGNEGFLGIPLRFRSGTLRVWIVE